MRQYIGARYMPKFMGNYDATTAYEALSVVDNGSGTTYISNKPTPAGTPLTDTDYWVMYGSSSGAIINLQNQIDTINNTTIPGIVSDLQDVESYIINNVKAYGAVGDGLTNDTQAFVDAIAASDILYIPAGTYMIDSLSISKNITIFGTGLETVLKCRDTVSHFIDMIGADGNPSYNRYLAKTNISNLVIDCDGKAAYGLYIAKNYYNTIESLNINAPTYCGIYVSNYVDGQYVSGAYSEINKCVVTCAINASLDTTGFFIAAPDQHVSNCEAVDCRCGFRIALGHLYRCAAWVSDASMYANSIAFNMRGSFSSMIECTADTVQYAVVVDNNMVEGRINGLNVIHNESVVSPSVNYIITFSNRTDGRSWSEIPFSIENVDINLNTNFRFCNYPSVESCLSEIETPMTRYPNRLIGGVGSDYFVYDDAYFIYTFHRLAPKKAYCEIHLKSSVTLAPNGYITGTVEIEPWLNYKRRIVIGLQSNSSVVPPLIDTLEGFTQSRHFILQNLGSASVNVGDIQCHMILEW